MNKKKDAKSKKNALNEIINLYALNEDEKKMYDEIYAECDRLVIGELRELARRMGIKSATTMAKIPLTRLVALTRLANRVYFPFAQKPPAPVTVEEAYELVNDYMLKTHIMNPIECEGIFDVRDNGAWLMNGFKPDERADIFVPLIMANEHGLKSGDVLKGQCRVLQKANRQGMFRLFSINGKPVDRYIRKELLELKTPERVFDVQTSNLALKAISYISPFCFGQRRLVIGLNALNLEDYAMETSAALSKGGMETVNLFFDQSPENMSSAQRLKGYGAILSCSDFALYDRAALLAADYARTRATEGHNVAIIVNNADVLKEDSLRALYAEGKYSENGSVSVIFFSSSLELNPVINRLSRTANAVTVLKNNYGDDPLLDVTQSYADCQKLLTQKENRAMKDFRAQIKERFISIRELVSIYSILLVQNKGA